MNNFSHSGDIGDIIYALPTIRAAGGGHLTLFDLPGRTAHGMTEAKMRRLKPLLELQPYITGVAFADSCPDHNLNGFRDHGAHGNLCDMHLATHGLDWMHRQEAWIEPVAPRATYPIVVHRSARYHNPNFPWRRIVEHYHGNIGFVGFKDEYDAFWHEFGRLPFIEANDFLELAQVIAGSEWFIGNQSSPLAVAHGMKHKVIMEICPDAGAQHHCVFQRQDCIIGWDEKIELPKLQQLLTAGDRGMKAEELIEQVAAYRDHGTHSPSGRVARETSGEGVEPTTSSKPPIRISACIITEPDDPNLEHCIERVSQYVDEVVVGVFGETLPDSARDAVGSHAELRIEVLPGDALAAWGFARCRNRVLDASSGDWIVHIDTDEEFRSGESLDGVVSLECITNELLLNTIRTADESGHVALQSATWYPSEKQELDQISELAPCELKLDTHHWRIAHRSCRWRGICHEELWHEGIHVSQKSLDSGIRMLHYGPALSKPDRSPLYAELLARAIDIPSLRSGIDPHWLTEADRPKQGEFWASRGIQSLASSHCDPYGTALPVLSDVISYLTVALNGELNTIVELGCGNYSTPFLRATAKALDSEFKSFESAPNWAALHGSTFVGQYESIDPEEWECDLLFIDHSPAERRIIDIERFRPHAKVVVVHDVEHDLYGYDPVLSSFEYCYTDMRQAPWTAVVSNTLDLAGLLNGLQLHVPVTEI